LLSFYTNPWIEKSGYAAAFGEMAGISAFVLFIWVPFYIWGGRLRPMTLKWHVVSNLIRWGKDREVGE
jgi:low affinity Fe/Cu permease